MLMFRVVKEQSAQSENVCARMVEDSIGYSLNYEILRKIPSLGALGDCITICLGQSRDYGIPFEPMADGTHLKLRIPQYKKDEYCKDLLKSAYMSERIDGLDTNFLRIYPKLLMGERDKDTQSWQLYGLRARPEVIECCYSNGEYTRSVMLSGITKDLTVQVVDKDDQCCRDALRIRWELIQHPMLGTLNGYAIERISSLESAISLKSPVFWTKIAVVCQRDVATDALYVLEQHIRLEGIKAATTTDGVTDCVFYDF